MEQFDYVIVGAGSAGCILADRLSADEKTRVLLLEAGPMDRSPWVHIPVGYGKLYHHPRLNWGHHSEPEDGLAGRQSYWPRGRVVGGSGSINAMVYVRGLPHDFDDWQIAGAKGWNWDSVRTTYDRLETRIAPDGTTSGDGPLHVQDVSDQIHPVNKHYFDALNQTQLPITQNYNGPQSEGGAIYQINTQGGRRCSSARAFLRPALRRKNLILRTGVVVRRVLFEGTRTTGVEYQLGDQRVTVAAGEVILSAGAVQSPRILQLSGIGPADHLQSLGIETRFGNDNVGGNLQDHLGINHYFRATKPTLNNQLAPWYGKALAGIRYALTRKGPLALSVNQCGGFLRSDPSLPHPDQQMYFNPVTYTTNKVGKRTVINPDPFPGFIICPQPARPTSRGRIDLRSADALDEPLIRPNSLATPEDQQTVIAGGKLAQRILAAPALAALIKAPMYGDLRQMSDQQILQDFRERSGTVFHPVSTCRMGADASTAVTDSRCRVFGVSGLRVIDASAFPNITSGNTNAPTMMLALRAADMVIEDRK